MQSDEDRAQLQSWRGVTGLLEERYLAEEHGDSFPHLDIRHTSGGNLRRGLTVPPLNTSYLAAGSASSSSRSSPLSALFDVGSYRSPKKSPRASTSTSTSTSTLRASSSIPTTPLARSRGSLRPSATPDRNQLHRTSILTSPIRERGRQDHNQHASTCHSSASYGTLTPSRQASEATIRPVRIRDPSPGTKSKGSTSSSDSLLQEGLLSTSPPAMEAESAAWPGIEASLEQAEFGRQADRVESAGPGVIERGEEEEAQPSKSDPRTKIPSDVQGPGIGLTVHQHARNDWRSFFPGENSVSSLHLYLVLS
jgi:hypothetical protein